MQDDNLSHWESNLDWHSWDSTHVEMGGAPWCSWHWTQPSKSTFGLLGPCAKAQVKYLTFNNTLPWKKKGYSTYSSRNKIFFMAIYNQTSLEKTRVPIDLKGEKAQNTPTHHLVHQKANHCISLHPQFNSVVSKLYWQQHI